MQQETAELKTGVRPLLSMNQEEDSVGHNITNLFRNIPFGWLLWVKRIHVCMWDFYVAYNSVYFNLDRIVVNRHNGFQNDR